eukprot:SM000129S26128  [mRNA]  locus=s129:174965:176459:+ [translate_table: standard]
MAAPLRALALAAAAALVLAYAAAPAAAQAPGPTGAEAPALPPNYFNYPPPIAPPPPYGPTFYRIDVLNMSLHFLNNTEGLDYQREGITAGLYQRLNLTREVGTTPHVTVLIPTDSSYNVTQYPLAKPVLDLLKGPDADYVAKQLLKYHVITGRSWLDTDFAFATSPQLLPTLLPGYSIEYVHDVYGANGNLVSTWIGNTSQPTQNCTYAGSLQNGFATDTYLTALLVSGLAIPPLKALLPPGAAPAPSPSDSPSSGGNSSPSPPPPSAPGPSPGAASPGCTCFQVIVLVALSCTSVLMLLF